MWLSLVERLLWEQNVAGSNPVTPTIFRDRKNFEMYFEYGEKEINYLKAKDKKKQEILSRRAGIDATKDFPHSHLTRKNCKSKPQIHLPSSMSMPKAFSTVI